MAWITLQWDPRDRLAREPPVSRATQHLRGTLERRGIRVRERRAGDVPGATGPESMHVVIAAPSSPPAARILSAVGVPVPKSPEALALVRSDELGAPVVVASGGGPLGVAYAVAELADRVACAADPFAAIADVPTLLQEPLNPIRSVARLFTSELEDLPWFRDRAFWRTYLGELVSQRFNRFSLGFGLGYNFHHGITDGYLYFPYPFLVDVPGYDVRLADLEETEREENLAALRFISDEAANLGLQFQLGLWNHASEWPQSPRARYPIRGLPPERHAEYCRDAIALLLEECPGIRGLTFRVHGEGGIPEGSWSFWPTVFEALRRSSRTVDIDLHSKGLDRQTLAAALGTGMPVTVSPKYWAEHMGLPYHQAAIRERERRPRDLTQLPDSDWHRHMTVSEGSRPFTRYGYADFLTEGRPYGVFFRLWPGTQRLLLWGDPVAAAGFGRASTIAGSLGMEWCEPLTFKGRDGTGLPGGRDGYIDPALRSAGGGWEKYRYTYRLLGRLSYSSEERPEAWRRYLRAIFREASEDAEAALASASRILPLVTTAHSPSASNNYFWPEIYTNMSVAYEAQTRPVHPFVDTLPPPRFGTVSALDPELFSSCKEFVDESIAGEMTGRYTPLEVADRLDQLAAEATRSLQKMQISGGSSPDASWRRWMIDVSIQASLGRFFARKLRAGVAYEWYLRTGAADALRGAIDSSRGACAAWAEAVEAARGVYVDDLTFGPEPWLRGHWSDRLPGIEEEVRRVEEELAQLDPASPGQPMDPALVGQPRQVPQLRHRPPNGFRPGAPITIEVEVPEGTDVLLRYRRLNQAEEYRQLRMERRQGHRRATLPGRYTNSPYPIQYLFRVKAANGAVGMFPGFNDDFSNQPYYVVRQARATARP